MIVELIHEVMVPIIRNADHRSLDGVPSTNAGEIAGVQQTITYWVNSNK